MDPDLSFLAAKAAVELDNLAAGRPTKIVAARTLAERIHGSLGQSDGTAGPRSLMDPATLTVVSEAVSQTLPDPVRTMDDLVREATSLASDLTEENPSEESAVIERVRTFCVALSRCAAAYRESVFSLRPTHPFRK
jgi:hypothetical protein